MNQIIDADTEQEKRNEMRAKAQEDIIIAEELDGMVLSIFRLSEDDFEELLSYIDAKFDDYSDWKCNYYDTYQQAIGICAGYCLAKGVMMTLEQKRIFEEFTDAK